MAVALLGEMQAAGLTPNIISYSSAIDACVRGGRWKEGIEVLEEMRGLGVVPDVITYHALMVTCAKYD